MTAPAPSHADAPANAQANAQADAVRDSLICPLCQYSLRGLPGEVIHCPECGLECDIRRMMTEEWRRPWYEAPGFNLLLRPVTCLTIGSLILLYVGVMETQQLDGSGLVTALCAVVLLVTWCSLVSATRNLFLDGRGPRLALLAHILFAGYLAGVFGAVASVFGLILGGHVIWTFLGLVLLALAAGVMMLCRRGERYIAQQCLNEYLRRDASTPTSWSEIVSS